MKRLIIFIISTMLVRSLSAGTLTSFSSSSSSSSEQSTKSGSKSTATAANSSKTPSAKSCSNSSTSVVPDSNTVCPANEEFTTCIQALCRAQYCSQIGEPIACAAVVEESCIRGCVCVTGTLRDIYGNCVPEDQCGDLHCEEDEVVNKCPNFCQNDYCPTSEEDERSCDLFDLNPNFCPPPECRCRFNYKRAFNGTCIPTRSCPPFDCSARPNEEYNPCPPYCPSDDCSQATPNGGCHIIGRIGIVLQCNPKCRCIEGYWRKDGICVPYNECPGICPPNEEFSECMQATCRAQNCSQIGQQVACPILAEGSCFSGCICKEGNLRAENGTCIPEDQCPKAECNDNEVLDNCPNDCVSDYCPTSENEYMDCSLLEGCPPPDCRCIFNFKRAKNETCIPTSDCPPFDCSARPNEEYDPCPPLCPTDNCSQASPSGECPLFGFIGIVLECNPACRCKKGYWRKNGICVPYEKCPGVCGPNEELSNCTEDLVTDELCLHKCICKEGFLRNDNGTCVAEGEYQTICPPNEEFSECIQGVCRAQNCYQYMQPVPCPGVAEGSCEKGCVCVEGTLRADNRTCIPEEQCDEPTDCDG